MVRKTASVGRVFGQVIVFLLLRGIVAGEMPELLKLTDNTTNDFTIRTATKSVISTLLRNVSRRVRAADVATHKIITQEIQSLRVYRFEGATFFPGASVSGTVLRT
jgi:hypothetical protein